MLIDLLTISGTGAMPSEQWPAYDARTSYAGLPASCYEQLYEVFTETRVPFQPPDKPPK